MCILSARIFSKSFGGKIKHSQTDGKKEKLTKKHDTINSLFSNLIQRNFLQSLD